MQATHECLVCMLKQALNTARVATRDPAKQREVMNRVARLIPRISLRQTPAAMSQPLYGIVSDVTGIRDPFRAQKKETNRLALSLLPDLRRMVARAKDPLDAAVHVAVAGNIIDLGIGHVFDIEKDIARMMKQPFAVSALPAFRRELKHGRKVVYLGDNAGEIMFDRILVEQMLARGMDVTFTVKSAPIINDATLDDACEAGLMDLVRVITTGSGDIGVNWSRASREFKRACAAADLIVAKGHGNFETCVGRSGNYYFLLKAKCDVVAAELGVKLGDMVFKHQPRRASR